MSPSLIFLAGLTLGILLVCSVISVYQMFKMVELFRKEIDGANDEVNDN